MTITNYGGSSDPLSSLIDSLTNPQNSEDNLFVTPGVPAASDFSSYVSEANNAIPQASSAKNRTASNLPEGVVRNGNSYSMDPNSVSPASSASEGNTNTFGGNTLGESAGIRPFSTEMARIQTLTGEDRLAAVINLQGTYDNHVATATQTLSASAQGTARVPELEAQLQNAIARDKADPNYQFYLADSEPTRQVRNELEQARGAARIITQDLLKQNPELQQLDGMMKLFASKELAIAQQEIQSGNKKDVKDEIILNSVGINGITLAGYLDPTLKDDVAKAEYYNARKGDKETRQLADNIDRPNAILTLANTSDKAMNVAAEMQARSKAQGNDSVYAIEKQKATDDILKMRRLSSTAEGQLEAMKLAFPNEASKARSDFLAEKLAAENKAMTPKDKQEISDQYNSIIAAKALASYKAVQFSTNIGGWDAGIVRQLESDPILSEAYGKLKVATGGKVSLEALAGSVAGITDIQARMRAKVQLENYTNAAVKYEDSGVYGQTGGSLMASSIINKSFIEKYIAYNSFGKPITAEDHILSRTRR